MSLKMLIMDNVDDGEEEGEEHTGACPVDEFLTAKCPELKDWQKSFLIQETKDMLCVL